VGPWPVLSSASLLRRPIRGGVRGQVGLLMVIRFLAVPFGRARWPGTPEEVGWGTWPRRVLSGWWPVGVGLVIGATHLPAQIQPGPPNACGRCEVGAG